MAQKIGDVMTHDPRTVATGDSLVEAARVMAQADIGPVVVVEDGNVTGLLTDRDIVVRAIAEGRDPTETRVGEVCSRDVTTLTPDQSVDDALRVMREQDVRRIPVVRDGRPVGIVSLGDLAVDRDPESVLADISAAAPND